MKDGFKNEKAIVTPYNIRKLQANNKITQGLYVTHIGYYPNAKNHYMYRETGAQQNILIYCSKGRGWIETDNKCNYLKENSFLIIPAHTPHTYGADELNPWSIYWIHFKGIKTEMFSSIYNKLIQIDDAENSRIDYRLKIFDEMYKNLEMGYSTDNLEYVSLCFMHFMASLKYIRQFRAIKHNQENDIIQACISFMRDNLDQKVSLQTIANQVGYSSNHLNVIFKESTSYTILEYFNQLKIQRACSLLQFTSNSIKEIAFNLNFYDQYHFSKAFKKEMEISPREYKKKYNKV